MGNTNLVFNIEVLKLECGYTVLLNGEVVFECLSKDELDDVTIADIQKYGTE